MVCKNKTATVFGGTGFVGRQIVRALAAQDIIVKVATRVPERAYFLRPCGSVGQVVPFACHYNDIESIRNAVAGSDYVVNCIGILYEKGKSTFTNAHVAIPAMIARICAEEDVNRLVHISALGSERASSIYARTKLEGEGVVLSHFPHATILRPSVIFGEGDHFFNLFAEMSRYLPFLPLIGGGKTKFQPVYVGDVAKAVMVALTSQETGPDRPQGKIYELGGTEVVSFQEIYQRLFRYTGRRRTLVNVPFGVAKIQAAFLSILPAPPLTPDQVESLMTDSITAPDRPSFHDLGIQPRSMDLILPSYLEVYRKGGRFSVQFQG